MIHPVKRDQSRGPPDRISYCAHTSMGLFNDHWNPTVRFGRSPKKFLY